MHALRLNPQHFLPTDIVDPIGRPAASDTLDGNMPLIGIPGNMNWTNNTTASYFFATVQPKLTSQPEISMQWCPQVRTCSPVAALNASVEVPTLNNNTAIPAARHY